MRTILKATNLHHARGLHYHHLQYLMAELKVQGKNLLCYWHLYWLRSDMGRPFRVYEFRNDISILVDQKGTEVRQLTGVTETFDFEFFFQIRHISDGSR